MHDSPSIDTAESDPKKEIPEILVMDNLGELKTPEEAEEIFDKEDRIRVRRSRHLVYPNLALRLNRKVTHYCPCLPKTTSPESTLAPVKSLNQFMTCAGSARRPRRASCQGSLQINQYLLPLPQLRRLLVC